MTGQLMDSDGMATPDSTSPPPVRWCTLLLAILLCLMAFSARAADSLNDSLAAPVVHPPVLKIERPAAPSDLNDVQESDDPPSALSPSPSEPQDHTVRRQSIDSGSSEFGPSPPGTPTETKPSAFAGSVPSNLHLVVAERFINRLLPQPEPEMAPVRDVIDGADVFGEQRTRTRIQFDVRPCANGWRGQFVLYGETQVGATGYKSGAAVDTLGRQSFTGFKPIEFDGRQFSTWRSRFDVSAENVPVAAFTPASGIPVLGLLAESLAIHIAQARRPVTEAIARQRVAEQASPKFDSRIDQQLALANRQLSDAWTRLDSTRLAPERLTLRSSNGHLHLELSVAGTEPVDRALPPTRLPIGDHGASIYLHESCLAAMVRKADLAGKSFTDRQLGRLIGQLASGIIEPNQPAIDALPDRLRTVETVVEFADVDPVRVEFANGEMAIILRATYKPGGEAGLPLATVRIPYRAAFEADAIRLQPGTVRVDVASTGADADSLLTSLLEKATAAQSPVIVIPREASLPAAEGRAAVRLRTASIAAEDGWMVWNID